MTRFVRDQEAGSGADPALAVRPKTLGEPTRGFSSGVVLTLSQVMEAFGISKTAAQYHIWNALYRTRALEDLESPESEPSPEWQGREDYTGAYFPIKSTSLLRRGEFAGWVVAAEKAGFISEDTAAGYLETDVNEYTRSRDMIAELYPAICQ